MSEAIPIDSYIWNGALGDFYTTLAVPCDNDCRDVGSGYDMENLCPQCRGAGRVVHKIRVTHHTVIEVARKVMKLTERTTDLPWLPIESAPKNYPIIVGAPGAVRIAMWKDGEDHENHGTKGGGWIDYVKGEDDLRIYSLHFKPTHWMSPPKTPSEDLEESGK